MRVVAEGVCSLAFNPLTPNLGGGSEFGGYPQTPSRDFPCTPFETTTEHALIGLSRIIARGMEPNG